MTDSDLIWRNRRCAVPCWTMRLWTLCLRPGIWRLGLVGLAGQTWNSMPWRQHRPQRVVVVVEVVVAAGVLEVGVVVDGVGVAVLLGRLRVRTVAKWDPLRHRIKNKTANT